MLQKKKRLFFEMKKTKSNFQVWNKSIRSTLGHSSSANIKNSLTTSHVVQKRKTDEAKVQKQILVMKKY